MSVSLLTWADKPARGESDVTKTAIERDGRGIPASVAGSIPWNEYCGHSTSEVSTATVMEGLSRLVRFPEQVWTAEKGRENCTATRLVAVMHHSLMYR